MAHIVIIGAGIGGMPCAYELREMLPKEHQITVVSAVDYFQFVPSNPWIAVGWRQREEIVLKVGPLLEKKGIAFIPSAVSAIDAPGNQLTLANGQTLAYDYLVITTGPKLSFDEVPGPARRPMAAAATPTRCARWTMPRPSGATTRSS
jgi:sulfide:quinone oxidoreductase